MPYSLAQSSKGFRGGKNILASQKVQFVHGGATIPSTELAQGLPVGTLLGKDKTTGKWVKYTKTDKAKYEMLGILNVDIEATTSDVFVGEIIIDGSVYEAKLPTHTDLTEFKTATASHIFYVGNGKLS